MPVQINEIIIRANIKEPPAAGQEPAGQNPHNASREEIIKECVERVMQLLNEQNER